MSWTRSKPNLCASDSWSCSLTRSNEPSWEIPNYPTYFFPADQIPNKFLGDTVKVNPDTECRDVVVGAKRAVGAAQRYTKIPELSGLLKIAFSAMDAWFEDDKQIFVHPKDPYKVSVYLFAVGNSLTLLPERVDVLQSSRHVRVEIDGVEVANTQKPRLLFETGLQVRTYIPKTDCRMDLLEHSDSTTQCPYKACHAASFGVS
jgi:Domain of unknown function (DUF427)